MKCKFCNNELDIDEDGERKTLIQAANDIYYWLVSSESWESPSEWASEESGAVGILEAYRNSLFVKLKWCECKARSHTYYWRNPAVNEQGEAIWSAGGYACWDCNGIIK